MRYKVQVGGTAVYKLNQTDRVASVLQNLTLLYATKQGTVPLYRDFGLPMKFIDKPLPVAQTIAAAEITEATERFESRATVSGITFETDRVSGRLIPIVEVDIHEP